VAGDPLLGHIIDGRLRIDSMLGAGGTGTVYRAYQTSTGRDVAIKVIHSRISQGTQTARRFLREAKLCSQLGHPSIVNVLDCGRSDAGLLYVVMELLEGRALGQVLAEDGPLSTRRVAGIGVQLCDALEAAHSLSIVHRDLKPSNVVVLDEPPGRDVLKVLDFGLARALVEDASAATLTQSDAILGTPAYISPEAVLGRGTDERSDLYSLGVMLYELVAGRLPYRATNVNMMLSCHVSQAPDRLGEAVAAPLGELIMSLLDKDPSRRPASAAAVREKLEPLAGIAEPPRRSTASEALAALDTLQPSAALGELDTLASGPGAGAAPSHPRITGSGTAIAEAKDRGGRGRAWLWRGAAAIVTLAVAAGLWWYQSRGIPGAAPAPEVRATSTGGDAGATPATIDAGPAAASSDAAAAVSPVPADAATPSREAPTPPARASERPPRPHRDADAGAAAALPDPTAGADAGAGEPPPDPFMPSP
jgi:eukaryotic-like serine/threonine-protein kinase